MSRRCLLLSALALSCRALPASAQALAPMQAGVERISERVLLVRDRPGSNTEFWMIVHAGSADEDGGDGIAHYLEHLVMVGSNPENADIAMRFFAGGRSHGATLSRATTYQHTAPARPDGPQADLEKLFKFYAARLEDFSISEADAARELKVVVQEFDLKISSDPFSHFELEINRMVLPDHPGNWSWRETREDILRNTVEAARAFHRTWYAPNNLYFVVRGNIEPQLLKRIADTALAGIPARDMPARAWLQEPRVVPEQINIRCTNEAIRRAKIYLKKLVRLEDGDVEASRAAILIAEGFLKSRLPESPFEAVFERGNFAEGARAITLQRVAPNTCLLDIDANVAPGVAPDRLLGAFADYVNELGQGSIAAKTVDRLKARFAATQAENEGVPRKLYDNLTSWLSDGEDFDSYLRWPQRVAAVTPEAVTRVLRALARPGRIVTGILAPSLQEARR
jgi:zinc protease